MRSMTGYGRASLEKENRNYQIEMKSVNHKYSDITIKLPKTLTYLEDKMKKQIGASISRGKVDVFVTFENNSGEGKDIIVNHEMVKKYMDAFYTLAEENQLALSIPVTEVIKLPEVLSVQTIETKEDVIEQEVMACLQEAIQHFVEMREVEGNKIKEDLLDRVEQVEKEILKFSEYSAGLVEEYVVKLRQRVKDMLQLDEIEESRIAQEAVIFADRTSIEEEVTRLKSHVMQMKNLLEEKKPVGKKMDFLIQEMNREVNTIGSKSANLDITNLVIDLKTMLEDIREQIQNIE